MVGAHISLSDDGSRAIDYWLYYGGILWNLATVSPLAGGAVQWKEDLPSGSGVGTETDSDLSADGRYTVSRDLDGQLVVIDTQLQKQIATLTLDDNVFLDLVMSDDGSTILVATQMGRLHHFRIENLPALKRATEVISHHAAGRIENSQRREKPCRLICQASPSAARRQSSILSSSLEGRDPIFRVMNFLSTVTMFSQITAESNSIPACRPAAVFTSIKYCDGSFATYRDRLDMVTRMVSSNR